MRVRLSTARDTLTSSPSAGGYTKPCPLSPVLGAVIDWHGPAMFAGSQSESPLWPDVTAPRPRQASPPLPTTAAFPYSSGKTNSSTCWLTTISNLLIISTPAFSSLYSNTRAKVMTRYNLRRLTAFICPAHSWLLTGSYNEGQLDGRPSHNILSTTELHFQVPIVVLNRVDSLYFIKINDAFLMQDIVIHQFNVSLTVSVRILFYSK